MGAMKRMILAVVVAGAVGGAGVAQAGAAPGLEPARARTPSWRVQALATGSVHFWGGLVISEESTADSVVASTALTHSEALAVGVQVIDNLELGVAVRYSPSIKFEGDDWNHRELDLSGRIAFHAQPAAGIDVAFAAHLGESHIYEPANAGFADPTGFVADLRAEVQYGLGSGFSAVTGFGYQRGFQSASLVDRYGRPTDATYTTDFMHADIGLGYRY
jgi:hypothetical protein